MSNFFRRSVPGSTLSELVVNLSPLCVPDTKRDTNKTENCFSLGCFICILMNFSTDDSSFSSIFMASTRTKITFRSLCMYAKTYAGYIIPKGRVPVFFVPNSFWATKGHGRGRRSLVLARDVGTSFLWFRSPWNNGTN